MYDELKTNLLIEQKGVYNIWNIQRKNGYPLFSFIDLAVSEKLKNIKLNSHKRVFIPFL